MRLMVALYPQPDECSVKMAAYLGLAKRLGYDEVFSSIHITESPLKDQLSAVSRLAAVADQLKLGLTIDIGGPMVGRLLDDDAVMAAFHALKFRALRLDYGCRPEQINQLIAEYDINCLVMNASTLDQRMITEWQRRVVHPLTWEACHNFYPRPLSGLTIEFMRSQNRLFHEQGIPVTACLPVLSTPRGPLYRGLPTVEAHRYCQLSQAVLELSDSCDGLMIADPYATEQKLREVAETVSGTPLTVGFIADPQITGIEMNRLLERIHYSRYDNSEYAIRLLSSRQMAENGPRITARLTRDLYQGDITIDNENYGRYSGEIQIMIKDAPRDAGVNVVGRIADADLWMLPYLMQGHKFYFKERGKDDAEINE